MQNYIFSLGLNSAETLDFSMDFSTCHYNNSKPRRRRSPSKSQYICHKICGQGVQGPMPLGYLGKQKTHKWREQLCEPCNDSSFSRHFHQSCPKCDDSKHGNPKRHSLFGRLQHSICHLLHISCQYTIDNPNNQHTTPNIIHHS